MADITLGQSIAGSLTSSDLQITPNPIGTVPLGAFYDEYDVTGVDGFRQLNITTQGSVPYLQLINKATGAIVYQAFSPNNSNKIAQTTFPGIDYKIRVLSSSLGDYQLSLGDGGKATSITSSGLGPQRDDLADPTILFPVGTIGDDGSYFPLAGIKGFPRLSDIALNSNNQLYGVSLDVASALYLINPGLDLPNQISRLGDTPLGEISPIKDTQGQNLSLNALEFDKNNNLYALSDKTNGLYQIDISTRVGTLIASLPQGFVSSGDLVYDAVNNRFLATSRDTVTTDALYQIPLNNPSEATKIGQIGFTRLDGLSLENGQLTGFVTSGNLIGNSTTGTSITTTRIKIDANTGVGTLDKTISGLARINLPTLAGISGASTIVPITPVAPPVVPVTPIDPVPPVVPVTPIDPVPPVVPVTPVNPVPPVTPVPPITSTITPITASPGLLQLSQGAGINASLLFSKTGHQTANRNELGIFTVDDNNGAINGITPGQSGYLAEVTKRSQVVFSSLSESSIDAALDKSLTRNINLAANSKVGFYLAVNDSIDSSTAPANVLFSVPASSTSFQNTKITPDAASVQVAFEDVRNGGDQDFNDLVFKISTATNPPPLGITQQGSKEIFDLTSITVGAKANFEIQRDAGYNNHVGFYKIEDALGTIRVGEMLIKPGENGYRQAAVQSRIAGVDLTGMDNQMTVANADFQGGALYAPFLIADSSVGNSDFSNVYTAYSLGNADKVDHIRLLGDNVFGFEDLNGGGDRDFNDLIVKATFT